MSVLDYASPLASAIGLGPNPLAPEPLEPRNIKPLIGVEPYYISAYKRIDDLSGAISRYASDGSGVKTTQIRKWAKEIILQCDLIEKAEKLENE